MPTPAMTKLGDVPCGPCRACCRYELIPLFPQDGDNLETYEHETKDIPGIGALHFLKHGKNGDCFYLGRDGCTIHDRAPVVCKTFDCRGWYIKHDRAQRREMVRQSPSSRTVLTAGRSRMATLDVNELSKVLPAAPVHQASDSTKHHRGDKWHRPPALAGPTQPATLS